MEELLLPLFPLEVVLLPEELLPLHIFEDRYKEMIGECLEGQSRASGRQEFGVVQAKGQKIFSVGCSARIIQVTRKYADGRMDILTVGKRRFDILFTDEEKLYLRGGVQFFDDDASTAAPPEAEARRAIELFGEILQRLHKSTDIPIELPRPCRHLSFRIAAPLPLDLEFKQRLLSVRNETDRLRDVIRAIELLIPQFDLLERARHKAGGNGNARAQK